MENQHVIMQQNETMTIECDALFIKKMAFIGTMQKVFGVLTVILGVLTCFGIITAIIGIPYIIAGVKLFKSGNAFSYACYSNDGKFLRDAVMSLAGFWMMVLICFIITLVVYGFLFLFVLYLGAASPYGY